MSTWTAVVCRGCGGAVASKPGGSMPRCLFCGADALEPFEPEAVEQPEGWVPFAVDDAAAQAAFRKFAGSSFWYPGDLRDARLELKRLLLPAWSWSGRLETHWTALVSASTASGKRPVGGADVERFDQILVPASKSLRQAELRALGAYDEAALRSWSDEPDAPREVSELTRTVARGRAVDEMTQRHRAALTAANGALKLKASSVETELEGRPVCVPVWIGAYRYGDRVYRVLVNGQSGTLVGEAPISWWRVAGAILATLFVLGTLATLVSLCAGGGAAIGLSR